MNKAFEKILKKTKEKCKQSYITNHGKDYTEFDICTELSLCFNEVQRIVQEVAEEYNDGWIPLEQELPPQDTYILLSFFNFSLPVIGRYEEDEEGNGNFYAGDEDETLLSQDMYVNAWQPLPEPYSDN